MFIIESGGRCIVLVVVQKCVNVFKTSVPICIDSDRITNCCPFQVVLVFPYVIFSEEVTVEHSSVSSKVGSYKIKYAVETSIAWTCKIILEQISSNKQISNRC